MGSGRGCTFTADLNCFFPALAVCGSGSTTPVSSPSLLKFHRKFANLISKITCKLVKGAEIASLTSHQCLATLYQVSLNIMILQTFIRFRCKNKSSVDPTPYNFLCPVLLTSLSLSLLCLEVANVSLVMSGRREEAGGRLQ